MPPGFLSQKGTAALTVINQLPTHLVIGNTACLGAVTRPQTSLFIQSLSSFEKSACFNGSKAGDYCCRSRVRACGAWLNNSSRSHQIYWLILQGHITRYRLSHIRNSLSLSQQTSALQVTQLR